MKIFFILLCLPLLSLNSCAAKGPSTFEAGIFKRDVAQVSLNTQKISKNSKEIEHALEETKAVKVRVGEPEVKSEEKTPEPKAEDKEKKAH